MDDLQKKVTAINNELKTKQALLKRVSGNVSELEMLVKQLESRDLSVKELERQLSDNERFHQATKD